MDGEVVIKAEGLSKRYRIGELREPYGSMRDSVMRTLRSPFSGWKSRGETFYALKDVSFEIKRGEVVGIIGRNGAGKSTLLKILARITKPTEGQAVIRGRVGSLLEVGTGFHPELTGRENIYLNGAILGMRRSEIARKFDEIVDFSEIELFLDTPVKRYSSGMYVRLAFSVAAHLDPEILLIDEVLAVGDAAFQNKSLGKMEGVVNEGKTIIFVSHQLGFIRKICTDAILLNNGEIYRSGDVSGVLDTYINETSQTIAEKPNADFEVERNKKIQILAARVQGETSASSARYDIFENITIKVKYEVRETTAGAAVIVVLKKNQEVLVISFDTDNNVELLNARFPGLYESAVTFPGIFKAGTYQVDVNIGILNGAGLDSQKNALTFEVDESSVNNSISSYSKRRPGNLAMNISWNTRKIDLINEER